MLLLRWVTSGAEGQVIANVEIATFFLTRPVGFLTLILGAALLVGITADEMACLMAIGMATAKGGALTAKEALLIRCRVRAARPAAHGKHGRVGPGRCASISARGRTRLFGVATGLRHQLLPGRSTACFLGGCGDCGGAARGTGSPAGAHDRPMGAGLAARRCSRTSCPAERSARAANGRPGPMRMSLRPWHRGRSLPCCYLPQSLRSLQSSVETWRRNLPGHCRFCCCSCPGSQCFGLFSVWSPASSTVRCLRWP